MPFAYGKAEDASIPMGLDALRSIRRVSAACREESTESLNASQKELLRLFGDTLSVLDRAASCWWRCSGSNSPHAIEYLIGGAASSASASLNLAMDGYYDESIGLTRSVAERANLLYLFVYSVSDFGAWISGEPANRWREYGPAKVRKKVERLGLTPPFGRDYYNLLSGRGVHPGAIPQVYSSHLRPATGGYFQSAGFNTCLVESASALSYLASFGIGILSHLPIELRKEIWVYPMQLAEQVNATGSPGLSGLKDHLADHPEAATRVPPPPSSEA